MKNPFAKLERLKRKAAKYYQEYFREKDRYSCGATLAEHINPRVATAKSNFNEVWKQIKKLDPNAPDARL